MYSQVLAQTFCWKKKWQAFKLYWPRCQHSQYELILITITFPYLFKQSGTSSNFEICRNQLKL